MDKGSVKTSTADYIEAVQQLMQTMDKKEIIKVYRLAHYYSFNKGAVSHEK